MRGGTGGSETGLVHKEMHSRVDYIVPTAFATYVGDERVVLEAITLCLKMRDAGYRRIRRTVFDSLPVEYSHLYLAIGGSLAAVICIEDPLRDEADAVITALHRQESPRLS